MNGAASKKSSSISPASSIINMLSRMTFEQVLGMSAVAGTGVFVVKVVRYAKSSTKDTDDSEDDDSQSMTKSASLSLLGFIRMLLRRLMLDEPQVSQECIEKHVPTSPGDGKVITHNGSCHCESIQFQVLAPRCLNAKEGPGKIQYRHTQINAGNFRVHAGHECLRTYYIYRNNAKKGAHAFCERCGVHILYAPSRRTPFLNINVNCMLGNGISKVKVISKKDDISEGFPADGQWDTNDQLSTISEVTQPFHFQMSHTISGASGDWKSYGRGNSSDLYSVGEADDDYEADSTSVPIRKVSVPPPNPVTPSTVSSSTLEMDSTYGNQITQLKMMAPRSLSGHGASASLADDLTTDDMSLSDEASLSSAPQVRRLTTGTMRRHHARPPRYSHTPKSPSASSPEVRNKMSYFLGKYKGPRHSSAGSSVTATTAASSMGELN
jgi:hypothetical protein